MSDASWQVFGTAECPGCGANVPVTQLLRGGHRCNPDTRQAHEEAQLAVQLEVLQFEIEEYLRGSRGRRHLAFARWCREHGR